MRTPGHDNAPATRLDIDLRTGGLHVYFLAEGSPFANRMVRLRQALDDGSEGARLDLLTTPQGECVVEGLPAGTWTIEPTHGGRFLPGTLTVTPGQTATATMDHRP